MSARPDLLELEGIRKSYGDGVTTEILHGIDLRIREGELVALVGPSGSGKSTLLNLIGLLDRPTQGRIAIDGRRLEHLDDRELTALRGEKLGFIFQSHHLLPGLSVIENVMLPSAAARGGFHAGMEAPARALLDAMGLGDWAEAWPRQLSGGMQQRVAVARALMNDPPLVLADEPTGNLDTETSDQVFDLLRERNADSSTAFLIVTHDWDLARRCARVIELVDGAVVYEGPPAGLRPPKQG
ncbi:MAG: ABC transporter ATP-binding protein [Deltaproteobacteria bacterium]|nr:ABC transporter ATP-binding protein [Deltaproteobacteria bacterium]NND30499.1 ABC transporter ATP-binding protein [Myxococcales bacterium]MBT8465683.1 ABC transporter ATP-binding protein [Deltaproteobacteria bacterium]NNK09250.1 ABC transporter ATP-binding protein [Myxococcales bacterium]NNK42886.1 ABC transporter ATP-binding protein [Myxococcales bacterium]